MRKIPTAKEKKQLKAPLIKQHKQVLVSIDNDDVFKNEQQTLAVLKEEGFIIASAEWDESNGKGIDKLLRNGFNPRFKCK